MSQHRYRKAKPLHKTLRSTLALALVAGGAATAATVGVATPASAAPAGVCTDTIYVADNAYGNMVPVGLDGAAKGGVFYDGTPTTGGQINQAGLSKGGLVAINTNSVAAPGRIVKYDTAAGSVTEVERPAVTGISNVAGAVNPSNGLYYYGGYNGNTLTLSVYNPTNNNVVPSVASISVPNAPGTNGDLAFGGDGRLYFVASSNSTAALYELDKQLPTSPSSGSFTAVELTRTTDLPGNTNGIAFASDGYLYLGRATQMTKVNPIDGSQVGSVINLPTGTNSTDLATCATPNTTSVGVDVGTGRVSPTDQFTVGIGGGSYDGTPAAPTATTTGNNPTATTSPAILLPGEDYTVTLTGANGTNLNNYNVGYVCKDQDDVVVKEGKGTSYAYTVAAGTGSAVECNFQVAQPAPRLALDKTVSPTSFDSAGDVLNYSFAISNTGDTAVNAFDLTDGMSGLTGLACTPIAEGANLAPGATTNCTASYTVTRANVTSGSDIVNNASVTGTPVKGTLATAADSATATNAADGVTATNDSANITFGDAVTLGGSSNDTAGTSAIDLASTVFTAANATDGGKKLETSEGSWEILPNGSVVFTPANNYSGTTDPVTYSVEDAQGNISTGTLTVTVRPGPSTTPTTVTAPKNGNLENIAVLDNGTPSQNADGSAGSFDVGSVRFVTTPALPDGSTLGANGKTLTVAGEGVWTVNPDGTVSFNPNGAFTGTTTPVTYQVTDSNGKNTTGSVQAVVRPGPSALGDTGAGTQNQNVTVNVLDNDTPGQNADGTDGTFTAGSVVLVETANLPAGSSLSPDGKTLTVTGQGVWTVNANGTVTFDPDVQFTGNAAQVSYQVVDNNNNRTGSTINVTITAVNPVATDDQQSTVAGTPVTLPGALNDSAGNANDPLDIAKTVFPTTGQPANATVSNGGKTLTVANVGTWTIETDGSVIFTPLATYSGTATAVYQIEDSNGTTDRADLSVIVASAPVAATAAPDTATTGQNVPVTLDLLANDVAGKGVGGVAGTFDPASVVFNATTVPAGAQLSADGRTVTIEGEGVYVINPANGNVRFTPEAGFTGVGTKLGYSVTDTFGTTVTSTLEVTVTAVTPTAVNDRATTAYETAVTVDVLANDTAGANTTLVPGTLKLVDPVTGNLVDTVTVTGQGVYTVVDGKVKFEPTDGFEGATSALNYSVADSNGTRTQANLVITVAKKPAVVDPGTNTPGSVTPVVVTTPKGKPVTVDVLTGVTPDTGTKLDPGTVCLIPTTLRVNGEAAGVGATGECLKDVNKPGVGTWVVNDNGTVTFTPDGDFVGTTTIDFQVNDDAGKTYVDELTVKVTGANPVTVDTDETPAADEPKADEPKTDGILPKTGGPALLIGLGGLALLGAGAAFVLTGRRRKRLGEV